MNARLRQAIQTEEFDYQMLLASLSRYAYPRDRISALLRNKAIIRVKKGLYVFGPDYARRPYSRELLANLIYGPSYLSLDYALSYLGWIPERVKVLTSVTPKRSRRFSTPVGLFTYRGIPLDAYATGCDRVEMGGGGSFMIASAEKALADKVHADRKAPIRSRKTMREYLVNDLRVAPDRLAGIDADLLGGIAARYRSNKLDLLVAVAAEYRPVSGPVAEARHA